MTYLDVTAASFEDLAKTAYDLSAAHGLGVLHFKPEPLTDEEAAKLVNTHGADQPISRSMHMDYVHGRRCKFHVIERGGRKYTLARWYDHSEGDTAELLQRLGLERIEVDENVVHPPQDDEVDLG